MYGVWNTTRGLMKGYAYSGEKVPPYIPTPLFEGWLDATKNFVVYPGTLYRFPLWKRAAWVLGYVAGKIAKRVAVNGT